MILNKGIDIRMKKINTIGTVFQDEIISKNIFSDVTNLTQNKMVLKNDSRLDMGMYLELIVELLSQYKGVNASYNTNSVYVKQNIIKQINNNISILSNSNYRTDITNIVNKLLSNENINDNTKIDEVVNLITTNVKKK